MNSPLVVELDLLNGPTPERIKADNERMRRLGEEWARRREERILNVILYGTPEIPLTHILPQS